MRNGDDTATTQKRAVIKDLRPFNDGENDGMQDKNFLWYCGSQNKPSNLFPPSPDITESIFSTPQSQYPHKEIIISLLVDEL
jgi:hypothetical protein